MNELIMLKLGNNQISDISALDQCVNLNLLELNNNSITDISSIKDAYHMATLYLNDNQISDISALSKYASLNVLKLQNNNISNIEPLRTLFDSCSFKVNFEDFLYYYNSMDDLRGNIVLYGNKITENEYRRVLPDYIIKYHAYSWKENDRGGVSIRFTTKGWIEAQQPYQENSENNNPDIVVPDGSAQQFADGNWYYVVNGNVDHDYNGIAKNDSGYWKIKAGMVDFGCNTLVDYNGIWWKVENGKICLNSNTVTEFNGSWWKITNGAVDFAYTGVANNEYGWWYIKNGRLDFTYNGLADNEYGSWKIINGAVDFSAYGIQYDYHTNKWYYFDGGAVAASYNGLAQNEAGWWKITKGQVDFGYTGFASNDAGIWYIINGAVAFDYTGTVDATIVSNGRAENHQHSWVHHEAEYREDFIPADQLERNDYGNPIFPESYSGVYESHYVCNQCKKDFGRDDHAVIIHLGESDFYTGCSNYSLERILMGAKKTELVSGTYDECSTCGAVR